jgi:hypothetical protein
MKKQFGPTLIGWLNIIILQWFFVRLYYVENDQNVIERCGLIYPIVPLTGWWGNYVPRKYRSVKL